MKEHPILFSGEMVRAILEGRKTQTRRVLKRQPIDILPMKNIPDMWVTLQTQNPNHGDVIKCRFGVPGDHLWVRESFRELIDLGPPWSDSSSNYYEYKADDLPDYNPDVKWSPSIHMPREASRITLEIVNIRVERVQEIDNHQSWKEGIPEFGKWIENEGVARDEFSRLWNKINEKRGFGWDVNPWVWVVEFKRQK